MGEFTVTKTQLLARLCFSLPGSFIALDSQVIADPNEANSYMCTLYSKTCLKRPAGHSKIDQTKILNDKW